MQHPSSCEENAFQSAKTTLHETSYYIGHKSQIVADERQALVKQAYEMMQLRRPPNRLLPSEYAAYGLAELPWKEKSQFLGARTIDVMAAVNDARSIALTRDKLIAYTLLRSHGVPFPEIKAVAHPVRVFPGARALHDVEAMSSYLQTEAEFPIFIKPVAGGGGFGSIWVTGYKDGVLQLRNGTTRQLEAYFNKWLVQDGLVFQAVAHPHANVASRIGPRLASARIVVLILDQGPIVHCATLRLPTGANMVDNFQHGASGNLLGAIDIDTGILFNVIGKGKDGIKTVPTHPDTGRDLIGMEVPDWEKAKQMCVDAAPLFAGIRFQSWTSPSRTKDRRLSKSTRLATSTLLNSPAGAASLMRPGGSCAGNRKRLSGGAGSFATDLGSRALGKQHICVPGA